MPTLIQSLIDIREEPFVLIDADYRIVAANAAYCSAYGAEEKQIVGRLCYEVSHHRTSPCHLHKEDCPHQQVFETGQTHEVFHVHYDYHGNAEQARILGYAIRDAEGRVLLGESIRRAPAQPDLNCQEIRLIGRSPALLRTIDNLRQAARSHIGVLLLGESGVGKELAAHFVHDESARADRPFLAIDCASLSESLFESEFFGHERGSFTGCIGRKQGLFETADGGTLFLDEIGELPLSMQAKLLRVLESGEFRRLGGRTTIRADVRVVAATNRDLQAMVARGSFREDLYYRLACITIRLPSLRDRRSDIPALAEALLARINRATGKNTYLTGGALEWLTRYDFPGNVRELRNMLERAVALAHGDTIDKDLLDGVPAHRQMAPAGKASPPLNVVEADYIRQLLHEHNGNRRQVARILDISERTVYRKIRRYNLEG
ncbi:MAG: sigma 54-interacting transcriptional regulator [Gammaproteobacteria bacterium]|nr:sigma 54-interacting transcriptional regulator [Gammaproteobacteria bacterium]